MRPNKILFHGEGFIHPISPINVTISQNRANLIFFRIELRIDACTNLHYSPLPTLIPLGYRGVSVNLISFVVFQSVEKADFKVGVEIDGVVHQVYVLKRPHVEEFLRAMANIYECVLFTASLSKVPVTLFLSFYVIHSFSFVPIFSSVCLQVVQF